MKLLLFLLELCQITLSNTQNSNVINAKITAQQNFEINQPALLSIEITNNSEETVELLQWNTPLEGLHCKLLEITDSEGKQIPYLGIIVKRGNPKPKHFMSIKAGEKVEVNLDFSEAYKITSPGIHKIQLKFRTTLKHNKKSEMIYCESNIIDVNFK